MRDYHVNYLYTKDVLCLDMVASNVKQDFQLFLCLIPYFTFLSLHTFKNQVCHGLTEKIHRVQVKSVLANFSDTTEIIWFIFLKESEGSQNSNFLPEMQAVVNMNLKRFSFHRHFVVLS